MSDTGYPIILTDGTTLGGGTTEVLDVSQVANSIADTTLTSLSLFRRGARNYAELNSENLVHILENFASFSSPANPIQGQLWFNPSAGTTGELMVYDKTGNWITAGNPKATGLSSAVNIAIGGDGSGSAPFDGTANITIPLTLASQPGLAPGVYVSPTLTIDAKGRITAATSGSLGAGAISGALGYVPANDALVVHKAGDSMSGSLVINNADVNVTGTGKVREGGNALIPHGFIGMWSGSSSAVPGGWALCDGSNGTPNLTGRFVIASGGGYADGATGGANLIGASTDAQGAHTHNLTIATAGSHTHGGATAAYALTINDLPSHTHPFGTSTANAGGHAAPYASGGDNGVYNNPTGSFTGAVGGGLAHSHTINADGVHTHTGTTDTAPTHQHTVSFDNRPLYYALAYIMKL
jgi:hypothetical protein